MSTTPEAFVKHIMKQIIANQLGCQISDETSRGFMFANNAYNFLYMFFSEEENKILYCLPRTTGGYCEASYDLNNFNLNDAMEFFGALLNINIANIVHQNELQANANLNIVNNNQQQEL